MQIKAIGTFNLTQEISTVITEYYDRINELEEKLKAIKKKSKSNK